ncbi:hypothetical protein ACGVWS_10640 [Enterobacteriaceae bacterium LUAb1]
MKAEVLPHAEQMMAAQGMANKFSASSLTDHGQQNQSQQCHRFVEFGALLPGCTQITPGFSPEEESDGIRSQVMKALAAKTAGNKKYNGGYFNQNGRFCLASILAITPA